DKVLPGPGLSNNQDRGAIPRLLASAPDETSDLGANLFERWTLAKKICQFVHRALSLVEYKRKCTGFPRDAHFTGRLATFRCEMNPEPCFRRARCWGPHPCTGFLDERSWGVRHALPRPNGSVCCYASRASAPRRESPRRRSRRPWRRQARAPVRGRVPSAGRSGREPRRGTPRRAARLHATSWPDSVEPLPPRPRVGPDEGGPVPREP